MPTRNEAQLILEGKRKYREWLSSKLHSEQDYPISYDNSESAFGNRSDGTPKGPGFLGTLPHVGGKVSTELAIGVTFDGKELEIPTLVPTLDQDEREYLLSGEKPTSGIIQKAVDHARDRMRQGKSPFYQQGE